jgi:hypothetical protein
MNYSQYITLNNTWIKQNSYCLSTCPRKMEVFSKEDYTPRVTLSMPQWRQYIDKGYNTLYGDAIIPGGTMNTGFGQQGAVYSGYVRQGIGMYPPS